VSPVRLRCRVPEKFPALLGDSAGLLALVCNASRALGSADRDRVNLLHAPVATKPFGGRTKPFLRLGEDVLKPRSDPLIINAIKQRSSIMWNVIISLIYHRSCRNYLAAARWQQT